MTAGLAMLKEKGWPWAPHCLESSVIGGVKGDEGLWGRGQDESGPSENWASVCDMLKDATINIASLL